MKNNPHLERLRLLYPVRWRLIGALFFMALTTIGQLALPKAAAYFIDHIEVLKNTNISPLLILLLLGAIVVQTIAAALQYYLFESCGHLIVSRIRSQLFEVLINRPISFYDKHHVGELTSRLTADVQGLQQAMTMGAAGALGSLFMFIGGVTMLVTISPLLSVVLALFIPASLYLGKLTGTNYRQRSREVQSSLADSGKVAHEYFTNVRLVHSFNQQNGALAQYKQAIVRLLGVSFASTRLLAWFRALSSLMVFVSLLLTMWLGVYLIGQGKLSVGDLTAAAIYSSMITGAASSLSESWNMWMRMIGSTDRIFALLSLHRPQYPLLAHPVLAGQIKFENVVFSYPERPDSEALKGISFSINVGEKIALVGASAAGKSTISSLILGHYQPSVGSLLFDNVDATILGIEHIRRHIAIVEQEPSLFSGSIFENIAFALPGRTVTLDEVIAAAKLANAHEFIVGFPQGYDTVAGERGVQLSGGQKQRIAIARALLRDPKILILDEATSALDSASELLVQRALDVLMEGRTTIIIAHRFSTIMKADRILVMDHGSIVQQGSHAELFQQKEGIYFQLMHNQLLHAEQLVEAGSES